MKPTPPAANTAAYLTAIEGWQRECVAALRNIRKLDEQIKWGHLVYSFEGPVLLIRAESERVLFGFWRGQRLLGIEPRLKAGGKYEMATPQLTERTVIKPAVARRLAKEGMNERAGRHITQR